MTDTAAPPSSRETDVRPAADGKQWRAEFHAKGLPSGKKEVTVPLEFVSLYSVPVPRRGAP